MEARGRGRGYGRAGAAQQQPGQGQQRPAAPAQPMRGPAPTAAAWVRPAQAWGGAPRQGAPAPTAPVGRGSRSGGGDEASGAVPRTVSGTVSGGGDASSRGAESSVRGRVVNSNEIVYTKPKNMDSKKGSSGSPINLSANFLPIISKPEWCLNQYRVDLAPDVDQINIRKKLVRVGTKDLLKGGYLFDGTVLYTPQKIHPDPVEVFAATDEGENIRITIRMVGELQWGDFHYIQLFNILIRKCLFLMGLKLVGRNYFLPENKILVNEHKLQLWPGYFTSMRQHEKNILLTVDLSFKIMRTDNVYDMLEECQSANLKREFQAKVIGSIVLTGYNNKTYRIDDVDFTTTPKSTFKLSDGSEISFIQYYQKKYSIKIRVENQPMLISRSKPREIRSGMPETVILVPELCQLTGLTDRQRENFSLMRTLADHTRVGAEGRIKQLTQFACKIQSKPECVQELARWDLTISNKLVQLTGRVLPVETIVSGQELKSSAGRVADWTKDVRSKPMLHAPQMSRLGVIVPKRFHAPCADFINMLEKCARGMKWSLGSTKIIDIPDDRAGTYLDQVEAVMNSANPTMLLIVLSTNSNDRYSAIKKKCCVDRGVPTQMIVARNLSSKGVMTIATKVAIQMNAKIGGAPWTVPMPVNKVMFVGYDVCRDTVNKKKCFAGLVASMDRAASRYYNHLYEHSFDEELGDQFAAFLVIACKKFHEFNNCYPERIVIFRDGVGEGQLKFVNEVELNSIKQKLVADIYKDAALLKMAFIVVSKRINTRIFANNDNPPPGTVVDDVITYPERFDYYIVSQCVRQGTVSPTSYNVLENTTGLDPDKLQILTYKMTHLYYNWSGTVRVPAPCQYAHKLAFLASQSLHRPVHSDLSTVLFFL